MCYSHCYTAIIPGEPTTKLHNDPYTNGDSHCDRHLIALSGKFTTHLDADSDRFPNINPYADSYTITHTVTEPNTL